MSRWCSSSPPAHQSSSRYTRLSSLKERTMRLQKGWVTFSMISLSRRMLLCCLKRSSRARSTHLSAKARPVPRWRTSSTRAKLPLPTVSWYSSSSNGISALSSAACSASSLCASTSMRSAPRSRVASRLSRRSPKRLCGGMGATRSTIARGDSSSREMTDCGRAREKAWPRRFWATSWGDNGATGTGAGAGDAESLPGRGSPASCFGGGVEAEGRDALRRSSSALASCLSSENHAMRSRQRGEAPSRRSPARRAAAIAAGHTNVAAVARDVSTSCRLEAPDTSAPSTVATLPRAAAAPAGRTATVRRTVRRLTPESVKTTAASTAADQNHGSAHALTAATVSSLRATYEALVRQLLSPSERYSAMDATVWCVRRKPSGSCRPARPSSRPLRCVAPSESRPAWLMSCTSGGTVVPTTSVTASITFMRHSRSLLS
mmetsp:Transcript_10507/g.36545  ORF Transcript_10507/g.36545 Transcript_10507/m.36545 type:complete len:433 (+) Transcript_10507:312-1610(+)